MQGWVGLHRKLMDNAIWSDPNYLKLWLYCLFKASHKEHEQLVGNQLIKLERGQFVSGRDSLEHDMNKGVKPKQRLDGLTWMRYLKNLQKWEMLNIKTTNKYSLVTVVNYGVYQDFNSQNEQHNEQQLNNKRTTNEQQLNTNNNVNKGNKKDNNIGVADIIQFWDNNGFGANNINSKEKLLSYLDDGMRADVILKALEIAESMNKKSYAYISKVLNDWVNRGIKNIEDVQALQQAYEEQKQNRTTKGKAIDWAEV